MAIMQVLAQLSLYFYYYLTDTDSLPIPLYARVRTCAFYKFSFSSITSITNYVNNLAISVLNSDRRVIEGVIVVIEERFFNYNFLDF